MMVSGVETDKKQKSFLLYVIAVLMVTIIALVGWSAYAKMHAEPRVYMQDTEETLKLDGSLWGDWVVSDVIVDGDVKTKYADGVVLDSLPSNLGWPPYYDAADNEKQVKIGEEWFDSCERNNAIFEMPATKVRCVLIAAMP